MKALVVLVHYFAPEDGAKHASLQASQRRVRKQAIERVIRGYRGAFGPSSTLRFGERDYRLDVSVPADVHLRVVTVEGCSLLDVGFRRRYGASESIAEPGNPRMLGFYAYRVFARYAQDYDWFVFSEDDLLMRDPLLFAKLTWFNRTFGDARVLSPNRYEWNDNGRVQKTYIDGALTAETSHRLRSGITDDEVLSGDPLGGPVTFRRASNPHSGFFAITRSQLAHWMKQPHWLDHDTSFVSPLESAATLGLAKTFAVYKAERPHAGFLEIEHLDNRFSGMPLPLTRPGQP